MSEMPDYKPEYPQVEEENNTSPTEVVITQSDPDDVWQEQQEVYK